ncbi:MAG: hypothetical protein PHS59_17915 [Paludibacter sp.]|nr:hypothetical protein [Paludibacter sp.]
MKIFLYCTSFLILIFVSCTNEVPRVFTNDNKPAKIYPDYSSITIPYNIAPLNFIIRDSADEYITQIYSIDGKGMIIEGKVIKINVGEWGKLLTKNKGQTLSIDIYMKKGEVWYKSPSLKNFIAPEPIDGYVSYRLIEPSYVTYEVMSINQRNLTNFDEREIYNNYSLSSGDNGQCINCHSFQNYTPKNMQMHVRGRLGGTVIINNDKIEKINLKTDSTMSGGVYPSWHPTEKLIAYSVNNIGQDFHTKSNEKVEVLDTESHLILYDIVKNEVSYITRNKSSMQTFPYWSPDGKFLYFVASSYKPQVKGLTDDEVYTDFAINYKEIKYDILRIPFNIKTHRFGKQDTVFSASKIGKSATFPRVSPDGKYLLFTMGDYGNFHIWHKSSDLYLLDLQNAKVLNLKDINSPDADSYHSWSSNGRWIIFSSRRDDGSYTRPYIAYFDDKGQAHKPFILPQKNPNFYKQFFKSYNIPEFTIEPIQQSSMDFLNTIEKDPKAAKFVY